MSLETTAASLEDQLVDGLSFKLGNSANYVTRRESTTIFASGSNSYSSNGTKVIRFNVVADGWLDPSTLQFQYKLTNNASVADTGSAQTRCQLLGSQASPFSRLMIQMGGQQCEDITMYNRFYNQMLELAPTSYIENFVNQGPGILEPYPTARWQYFDLRMFGPGASKTMSMPLICGTMNQRKWLPLRWVNLVVSIELSEPSICCRSGTDGTSPVTTFSSDYTISDCVLKADVCTLDNSLEEEFSKVLLSGRKLSLEMSCYSHQTHSMVAGEDQPTVTSTRQVSRLKSAFASFFAQRDSKRSEVNAWHHPIGIPDGGASHPATLANDDIIPDSQSISYQWALNSNVYPTFPVRSFTESWCQLTKALGQHNSTSHPIGIDSLSYQTDTYMLANDFEVVLQASFSGQSLRSGGMLQLILGNMSLGGTITASSADAIKRCYILLMFSQIIEISSDGVTVLD